MNTLEVMMVFFLGFISALPMTLLFAASMRSSDIRSRPVAGDQRYHIGELRNEQH